MKHSSEASAQGTSGGVPFDETPANNGNGAPSPDPSGTLDSFVSDDKVVDAEIRWVLKNVMSTYSFRSSYDIAELFAKMFPDRAIANAKSFRLKKDKCIYFLNYGIAPHFQSLLLTGVNDSEFYCISFDERLNSVMQKGQMDLVENYWDNAVNQTCTRYLGSTFVGRVGHRDLFEHFNSSLGSLDKSKLLQVAMDGPNVNWLFYKELVNYRAENDMDKLVPTGSGGLHSVHGALETGEKKTDWKI